MRLLRAADRAATPWKNGGGVTREVAAWPTGAGFDDFHWRVSMAEVREDGPFSVFPGVDRVLVVLEGGMRLTVDGAGVFDLSPGATPAVFDGGAAAASALTAGPVLDLNVMTRRGAIKAQVDFLMTERVAPAAPGHRLLVAAAPGVQATDGVATHALDRYDAVLTEGPLTVRASATAPAWLVSLSPA